MSTLTRTIKPFDILIEERQRKEFPRDHIDGLKASILKNGLYHAPGLRSPDDPTLVFGHCRTIALQELIEENAAIRYNAKEFNGEIPYVAVGHMDELQLKEIELSENLDRRDLTWQEKAQALADLEALRNAQRDHVASFTDSVPQLITNEELARETKKSAAHVSEHLALADHLDDPDVAKAKSPKEAKKIIERKAKEAHAHERSQSFNPEASQHTLLIGDCRARVKEIRDGQFAAVVTDPPYGIDMHKDQSWDGTWHEYDDTEAYCFNLITSLLPEWARVTQSGAHLYIFCDFSKFQTLYEIVKGHGVFAPMPYPFIWNKGNVASYPRPEHWPRKSFECILYAVKGDKPHNKLDLAVIDIPQQQHHDHPAGKPAELYAHLINRSCLPGDEILDCFAGQGTIFRAAHQTSTTATGIELSEKYATLAKNTLADLGE